VTAILDRLSFLNEPLPPALTPTDKPTTCKPWCTVSHPNGDDVCMSDDLGAFPMLDEHGDPATTTLTMFAGGTLPASVSVGCASDLYSPDTVRSFAFALAYAAGILQPEETCKCRPDVGKPGVLTFTQPVELRSGDVAALLAEEADSDEGPLTLTRALELLRARLAHGWADDDRYDWADGMPEDEAATRRVWAVDQVRRLWPHLDDKDLAAFRAYSPTAQIWACAQCGLLIQQQSGGDWIDLKHDSPYCTRRASHQPSGEVIGAAQ
jgi:hypothetical protein